MVLYIATGFITRDVQRPEYASTLGYVLLLVLMLTWVGGVVAFLFDRGRLPLVLIGVLQSIHARGELGRGSAA